MQNFLTAETVTDARQIDCIFNFNVETSVAKKNSAKTAPATTTATSSANLGFESKLWLAADKLRGTMDSGEYKHVVLACSF